MESYSGFKGTGEWGPWVSPGLAVSPPNLQGQQPVVVGNSVLSSREEAGIDVHVIFVPVETQSSVAGSVVPRGRIQSLLDLGSDLSFALLAHYVIQGSSLWL